MPLDSQSQLLLEAMAGAGFSLDDSLTPDELRALLAERAVVVELEPVARVEDRTIPGPGGDLTVRIYWPGGEGPFPLVTFYHGGGWVLGDLETHDPRMRQLTNRTGAIWVSVDYRLAPEHPFPAAPEDCWAALQWVAASGASLGGDPARLAVAGDSAGGNLAAVTAIRARDEGGPALALQVLVYPCTDMETEVWPSMQENAGGYFLTTPIMEWFYRYYVGEHDRTDPRAAPYRHPDLSGLASTLMLTAEFDPLRDEGEAYADRLRAAGVDVAHTRYDGTFHGFLNFADQLDVGRVAQDEIAAAVRAALGT